MSEIYTVHRTKGDGKGWPVAGTKVKYIKGSAGYSSQYTDRVVNVTTFEPTKIDGIVVNWEEGRHHGQYCTEWYESPVAGLTESQKQNLTEATLDAATKRGYCDETKKILSDLGLPTSKRVKKIVEFFVDEDDLDKVKITVGDKVIDHRLYTDDEW